MQETDLETSWKWKNLEGKVQECEVIFTNICDGD